jgi:hypothetical protein
MSNRSETIAAVLPRINTGHDDREWWDGLELVDILLQHDGFVSIRDGRDRPAKL